MVDWLDIDLLRLGPATKRNGVPKVSSGDVEQMHEMGPIQPVSVRLVSTGSYEILAGAKTWLCAQRCGLTRVPVFVIDDLDDEQARRVNLHSDQDPIGEAEAFAEQLQRTPGPSRGRITRLARALNRNRAYVAHALRLLRLPEAVKVLVRQGSLSAGHARALLRLPTHDQAAAARRIQRDGLSVRQAEELAHEQASRSGTAHRSPDIVRLEQRVTQILGCGFSIDEGQGSCRIDYQGDLNILGGVLNKLGYTD